MPVQRVVVEVHFGIQRVELAVFGKQKRIDLDERCIDRLESLVQRRDDLRGRRQQFARQSQLEGELSQGKRLEPDAGIDKFLENQVRRFRRDFFNVHAAGGRSHDHRALACPIDDDAQIKFFFDRQAFLDQNAPDLAPFRARSDG